ncbi:MAG: M1 family metallopeptidase [Planctomycetota bacterium]
MKNSMDLVLGLANADSYPGSHRMRPLKLSVNPVLIVLLALLSCHSAPTKNAGAPTRQEELRGSITPERAWWDLLHYDLAIQVFPESKSLKGSNRIRFATLSPGSRMQIDLQPPLEITEVRHAGRSLAFLREGNVYWIDFSRVLSAGREDEIQVFYEGVPVESERPPWSGGLTWSQDDLGNPFIATTCQGIGASIWWPNKDHGYDEPDRGMDLRVTVPAELTAVCNGRLISTAGDSSASSRTFHWRVTNPINNYGVNMNIGMYSVIPGSFEGAFGKLDMEYWVLQHQVEQAREQFKEVPRTLAAFEHWFGKYPFYEDSYKLVVVPYLGMEHQSSVTYGNGFQNGYRGRDLSKTGVGMKFDFIVVHETAHEWWGNNISMRDAADMWIHESFANYAENLFVEYHFSESEAQDYVIGCRDLIQNDSTIIGEYGLNRSGSSDMYYKGGNMLHTMRHVLNDDEKWRQVLRGINQQFWHKTVTSAEFEAWFSEAAGYDFGCFFDQYLRTTDIPLLRYEAREGSVAVWFEDVVPGFRAALLLRINGEEERVLVSEAAREIALTGELQSFELDRNFYMRLQD